MSGAAIALDQVRFAFGERAMRFDVAIRAGERVAVMGPSGSGKSTLLNLIAGFETPDEGRVLIDGLDLTGAPPQDRPVSMIFQENNLFGHLNVFRNVALGRSPSLKLGEKDRAEIEAALARTGLGGKGARMPAELSGGERQRVALARILVRDRPVLLLDEALGSLDRELRSDMLELLDDLQAERDMTLVMVTHQEDEARTLCDRLLTIEAGAIVGDVPIGRDSSKPRPD